MNFRSAAEKIKGAFKKTPGTYAWDMSTKEAREAQVKRDYEYTKEQKGSVTAKFKEYDEYYNNRHYTQRQIAGLMEKKGLNFIPPVIPEPYIQVETQIVPDVPDFEFKGRDDDLDSEKAKERQKVVEFICYNNKLNSMNPDNERHLNKLGNAFWKVSFDGSIVGPGFVGDIIIGGPDPANIFPDPAAYDIDDCEYIMYSFRMHRRKARRTFGKVIDGLGVNSDHGDTEIYTNETRDVNDDTVQVVEYWYRDDEGDIACSIQVNNVEVKHIPKYWVNTRHSGNKSYPFVKYCKIPMAKSFWDKSEIEPIKDLCDAIDREFMTAILNDALTSNDIILIEENALADGQALTNEPGAIVKMKDNKLDRAKRLGGISANGNILNMINFIREIIQETTGNFDSTQGKEPVRVTTASGIAQLNERADRRGVIKKADRLMGFERLYELVDWTALEFYNTDRMILIRGKEEEQDESFAFNSENHRSFDRRKYEQMMQDSMMNGVEITPEMELEYASKSFYYPRIDTEVSAGDGLRKSKAFTIQATQDLAKTPITQENYKIILSFVELLDLPNKKEIKDAINQRFAMAIPPGAPGGVPGMTPQNVPPGPSQEEMVMEALANMTDEERAQLQSLPDDEMMAVIMQGIGGGENGA
jgi:hypothetical protein